MDALCFQTGCKRGYQLFFGAGTIFYAYRIVCAGRNLCNLLQKLRCARNRTTAGFGDDTTADLHIRKKSKNRKTGIIHLSVYESGSDRSDTRSIRKKFF